MNTISSLIRRILDDEIGSVLAGGAGGALAIKVLNTGIAFVVQVVLARLLGAESYGDYVYALTWMNVLALIGTFGLDTAALRYVAEYRSTEQWGLLHGFLRASSRATVGASVAVAVVAGALVWGLGGGLRPELFATFLLSFVLLPVHDLQQVRTYSLQALKRVVVAQAPRDLLRPVLLAGFAWGAIRLARAPASGPTAMVANIGAALVALVVTERLLRASVPELARETTPSYELRGWRKASVSMLLVSGAHMVLSRTDILMLGALVDTEAAGVYAVATRIATFVSFGLVSANAIVAPLISQLYAEERRARLQTMLRWVARGTVAFGLPVVAVLFFWGREVLSLFGAEFPAGYAPMLILSGAQLVNCAAGSVGFLMTMTDHQDLAARIIGASAILNVVLNYVFVSLWGMHGAAVATAVSTITWNLALTYAGWKRLGLRAAAF